MNLILSAQCTLGDGGKILSRNSIPIKTRFQTKIAYKPNMGHKYQSLKNVMTDGLLIDEDAELDHVVLQRTR